MTMIESQGRAANDRRSTEAPKPARRPRSRYRVGYGYWWWALPAVVLMIVLIYLAIASGAFYAFTNWTGIGSFDFIGLKNFRRIFQTAELTGALKNSLILGFGFLVFTNILGLLFALALNRRLKTRHLLRVLLFMPVVIAPIAVSYIWKFIFAYEGPLNQVLGAIGLKSWQHDWLTDPKLALAAVLVVMVWQNTGMVMVIYLAGLATVPAELEEAAAIDGAGAFRRFRAITIPMIQPSIAIATTLMLIQGFRIFDQVLALTGGGPAGATQTLATEVYQQTFVFTNFGFGAALALVLSVLIFIVTIVQQYATRDRT
ncbi:carbohydrate ABC transporter permease [Actinoallomurus iriomotensis]|uniref:Sugar ABC transporter permease n=1 Tax=Actinoallomurus iriomotensis TaxID=478107 RepID=A0A9W6VWW0_9ACTN|nr:sugar ABC transporter permease [Actinoallomurus iriomotensis]GLY81997.1 sugar ABC transporter permease [Actinoallomurus iriomotensis]